ncbi:PR domain zinc finger protein 8 [Carlito syrichta]|uniref:PR domain zinc finger protein 8 n=1 Tax=Carlito syrichta TaxID=1868482 RepID=A0A1U7UFS4_CARSF|nr:PR domain zinc finger protein 8 [Carlito syrichta]
MEDSGIQRGIWDGDAKAVQQCLTDIFTSVYTTCDIPENAIFGPCVLSHTSLYDSIAFIALKSTDKRTVPYIFRVDTSAANGSSEGLMWLRLVQSARDKEEQNLEAYIKNGQLFYRSLRRIAKDEELLVWYGKELTELLLLCSSRAHHKMNGAAPYTCLECSQRFQFEFPYVAHLRFRCPKRLHSADVSPQDEPSGGAGAKDHGGGKVGGAAGKGKRKFPEDAAEGGGGGAGPAGTRGRFAERPPPASKEDLVCTPQQYRAAGSYFGLEDSGRLFAPPSPETGEAKRSAFVEVKKAARAAGLQEEAAADAFAQLPPMVLGQKLGALEPCHPADGVGPARLYPAAADPLAVKLQGAADLNVGGGCAALPGGGLPKQSPFLYATAFWPKSAAAAAAAAGPLQLQLPSALTLLPPSFTSLCLPAQNWCAKCNASFRMTSDLVYHMRSHHKKEYAMEPLVKRRREEKLKCPICNESFRERHHLSRHMTSHN